MASKVPYLKTPLGKHPRSPQYQADHRFYCRKVWSLLRREKLSLNPLCQRCEAKGKTVAAEHVHHIKEVAAHPDLALDLDNLESLCQSCHSTHTLTGKRWSWQE